MTADRPLRAALYARVSTVGHGQDPSLQVEELRRVAAQRGWLVSEAHEYIDAGISGIRASRPALDRMLEAAQVGEFDVVAVWKLDRLGRSVRNVLALLDTLTSYGVGFASIRDAGLDTTSASGRLLLQILASFAEFERTITRERVIAGVRRAQAAGKHCGRPRVEMDLRPALALLREGRSLKEAARILQVSRNTLRRRLREAGEWPINPNDSTHTTHPSSEASPP